MANAATTSSFLHHKQMERLFHRLDWAGLTQLETPEFLYIGLYTTLPDLFNASGVEVSTTDTGYARVAVAAAPAQWDVSTWQYSNAASIDFDTPTGSTNWGTIVGACILDAATAGNLLYTAELTTAKPVNQGDGAPRILANQLRITRADCAA